MEYPMHHNYYNKHTSIYFNNKNSYDDFGLGILDMVDIPIANEVVETLDNGATIRTGKYLPIELPITFIAMDWLHITKYQSEIVRWLKYIKDDTLTFSFMRNQFYRVKNVNIENISRSFGKYNTISVVFTLEPFRYEAQEPILTYLFAEPIFYNGTIEGEGRYEVYGNGTITFQINDTSMTVRNVDGSVIIDSKHLLVLDGNTLQSKVKDVSGEFPVLRYGLNDIIWNNIDAVIVERRTAYI